MDRLRDVAGATHAPGLAWLAACAAAFLWGTGAPVLHLLVAHHGFTPAEVSSWRFAIGGLVLLLVFGPGLRRAPLRGHVLALILAGTAMAGYVLCWFLGIERMGAAVPTLIALCLPPVLVTVVAISRGRDRLDGSLVAALAAALAGTGLVVLPHGGPAAAASVANLSAGVALSVAPAVLHAGFTMVSGRLSQALGGGPPEPDRVDRGHVGRAADRRGRIGVGLARAHWQSASLGRAVAAVQPMGACAPNRPPHGGWSCAWPHSTLPGLSRLLGSSAAFSARISASSCGLRLMPT